MSGRTSMAFHIPVDPKEQKRALAEEKRSQAKQRQSRPSSTHQFLRRDEGSRAGQPPNTWDPEGRQQQNGSLRGGGGSRSNLKSVIADMKRRNPTMNKLEEVTVAVPRRPPPPANVSSSSGAREDEVSGTGSYREDSRDVHRSKERGSMDPNTDTSVMDSTPLGRMSARRPPREEPPNATSGTMRRTASQLFVPSRDDSAFAGPTETHPPRNPTGTRNDHPVSSYPHQSNAANAIPPRLSTNGGQPTREYVPRESSVDRSYYPPSSPNVMSAASHHSQHVTQNHRSSSASSNTIQYKYVHHDQSVVNPPHHQSMPRSQQMTHSIPNMYGDPYISMGTMPPNNLAGNSGPGPGGYMIPVDESATQNAHHLMARVRELEQELLYTRNRTLPPPIPPSSSHNTATFDRVEQERKDFEEYMTRERRKLQRERVELEEKMNRLTDREFHRNQEYEDSLMELRATVDALRAEGREREQRHRTELERMRRRLQEVRSRNLYLTSQLEKYHRANEVSSRGGYESDTETLLGSADTPYHSGGGGGGGGAGATYYDSEQESVITAHVHGHSHAPTHTQVHTPAPNYSHSNHGSHPVSHSILSGSEYGSDDASHYVPPGSSSQPMDFSSQRSVGNITKPSPRHSMGRGSAVAHPKSPRSVPDVRSKRAPREDDLSEAYARRVRDEEEEAVMESERQNLLELQRRKQQLAHEEEHERAEQERRRLAALQQERAEQEERRIAALQQERAEQEERRIAALQQERAEQEERRIAALQQERAEQEERRIAALQQERAEQEERRIVEEERRRLENERRQLELERYRVEEDKRRVEDERRRTRNQEERLRRQNEEERTRHRISEEEAQQWFKMMGDERRIFAVLASRATAAMESSAAAASKKKSTPTVRFVSDHITTHVTSTAGAHRITTAEDSSLPTQAGVSRGTQPNQPARSANTQEASNPPIIRPPSTAEMRRSNNKEEDTESDPVETIKGDGLVETREHNDGKVERTYRSGKREIVYSNGTTKVLLPTGHVLLRFNNGDVKTSFPSGKSIYWYAMARTTHVQYPSGLQVFEFESTNQIERHYADGKKEILFSNGTYRVIYPDGTEEELSPRGTLTRVVA